MSLNDEERGLVVSLELEKAFSMMVQARLGKDNKMWDMVANRLYYAAFHAVCALLINGGFEVETHRGAAIRFRQYYVVTGVFSVEESHLYSRLQQLREEGDYNCYIQTSEQEIVPCIEPTQLFIEKIKNVIGRPA